MSAKLKSIVRFSVMILITTVIVWYLFKDIDWAEVWQLLAQFNYWWIALSMGIGVLSHLLRAWRWKLMMDAGGHNVWFWNSFFAVMIGYLMNSVFPRLGEVSRCGVMNRKEKIPVPFALGTVVTERIIDLLLLILVSLLTLALQFNLLKDYYFDAQDFLTAFIQRNWWVLIILGLVGLLIIWFWRTNRFQNIALIKKLQLFVDQGFQGVRSLNRIKNQKGFWLATISIWVLYFFMLYVITLGSEETKYLGPLAGLSILVTGSFGMASPTPNGIGAFHALVAGVLVLYGIAYDTGIIIATILHTSQFVSILVMGAMSLLLVNVLNKKRSADSAKNQG
mgnify:CR=1 FL=1